MAFKVKKLASRAKTWNGHVQFTQEPKPEVVEDTLTKQRKMQEDHRVRAEKFIAMKAPQELIDYCLKVSKMTLGEYHLYLKEEEEREKKLREDYIKTHPIQESIVNLIYEKAETIEPDYMMTFDDHRFIMELDPLKFMSYTDYLYDLYDPFLRHAYELTIQRYKPECD